MKRTIIWIFALALGTALGLLGVSRIDEAVNFIATVYTRLFQLLAVPTIVLSVISTFATFGSNGSGKIFANTLIYTLLTTVSAAAVGAILYVVIAPDILPADAIRTGAAQVDVPHLSYLDHIIGIVPNNIVRPFLDGNVLSLILLAFAMGIGLSKLPESENKSALVKSLLGLQDLLFMLIRGLVWALPLGIVAFAAQLSAQVSAGAVAGSIGKYVLVVLGGNVIQFFLVLPLFLVLHRLNPLRIFGGMLPAVMMALFTKSSAATLPVTMQSAEERLGASKRISRFVLPICTTVNMNGCAAFILVTSLFVMQNGGTTITLPTILTWLLISVVSAVGNAGVPMGCYFLTLSLMSGIGAPVAIFGVILPIYTVIDMVETAENVWSDSCVCAIVDKKLGDHA